MKRILILTNGSQGLFNFRKELLDKLINEKNKVYISIPNDNIEIIKKVENIGCKVTLINLDRRGINPIKDFILILNYFRLIKKIKPDIVLMYTIKPNLYGGIICRLLKISYISTITGIGSLFQNKSLLTKLVKKFYRFSLKNSKCVFFQNKSNLEFFKTNRIVEENYKLIVEEIMEKINGCLYFSGKKLIKIENNFFIQARNKTVSLPTEKIKIVDSEYIKNIHSQALKCISENDFDSVVTKSRTLLEEVYCYGIEQKGEEITEKGNINKLYRKIRELYDMNTEKNLDNRIKKLLSGLNSIVDAIAEIRNNNSDAHGVGKNRIKISEHHANLVLNSATTLAEFILSVIENKNNN